MPARTLNDFFAGFFYANMRTKQEAGMIITYKSHGNGDMKKIKVEVEKEKGKGVIVSHEKVSSNWKRCKDDNFSQDWSRDYSV
jgi:hypothetical protein